MTKFKFKMKLNPNSTKVEAIRNQLSKNPHCPCMIIENEDTLCPCKPCRERGICICGLYIKEEE